VRPILLCALVVASCSSGAKYDDAPPVPMPTPTTSDADAPKVYLGTDHGEVAVVVEIVSTEPKVEKGLMYRQHMPPDNGMLFLLDENKDWKFWMRNTLIPLDMIFIRTDLTIAGIVQNAEPKTDTLRSVGEASQYVLEVNGGWTAAHGIKRDAKVRFDRVR
jgi:uncharacterized protein